MKKLSSLFALALCVQAASAAPYVVYSGEAQATVTSASGPVVKTTEVYLITDLADTSSYGVLQFDSKTKQGAITIYPITNPTADESNLNFFGNVATTSGKNSLSVLSIGDILTDSSNNANISHAYATGTLTSANTVLSNARAKLTFTTRSSGTVTGTVTFPAAAAINNASLPYPPALNGTTLSYTIAAAGALTQATADGNFGISLDYNFTPAANIGDEYSSSKNTVTAIYPVNNPAIVPAPTQAVAYSNWLNNLATALGVTIPANNLNLGGDDGGGVTITVGGGGNLTLGGYTGGTGIGGGTIIVTGGTINAGHGNEGGTGTLTLGGTGTTTGTGGDGDGGGVITVGNGGDTGTTTGTGSITIGGGSTTITSSLTLAGGAGQNGTLTVTSAIVAITAINGNIVSGTVTNNASGLTLPFTFNFSGMNVVLDGVSNPALLVGQSFTGSASLSGGTLTNSVYSNGTLTITTQ